MASDCSPVCLAGQRSVAHKFYSTKCLFSIAKCERVAGGRLGSHPLITSQTRCGPLPQEMLFSFYETNDGIPYTNIIDIKVYIYVMQHIYELYIKSHNLMWICFFFFGCACERRSSRRRRISCLLVCLGMCINGSIDNLVAWPALGVSTRIFRCYQKQQTLFLFIKAHINIYLYF